MKCPKCQFNNRDGAKFCSECGSKLEMTCPAIGDNVNLASRTETTARPGTILVSGHTHKLAMDYFMFESLGKVRVKGKEECRYGTERKSP